MTDLYTVEQAASVLGLHIKTVRGYVRDGRLKATRIGKSYRIARTDLETFLGAPVRAEPVNRQRRAEASTVVQIDAVSPELMSRITTTITAGAGGSSSDIEPLHVQFVYDEQYGTMKIIVVGGLNRTADTLKIVNALVKS